MIIKFFEQYVPMPVIEQMIFVILEWPLAIIWAIILSL